MISPKEITEQQELELSKAYLQFLNIASTLETEDLTQIADTCNEQTYNAAKLNAQNVLYGAFLIKKIENKPDTDKNFLEKISDALDDMDGATIEQIFTNENITAIMNVPLMLNLIKESKKIGKTLQKDPDFVDSFFKALWILFVGAVFLSSAMTIISIASESIIGLTSGTAIFRGALAYASFGFLKATLVSGSENIEESMPAIETIKDIEQKYENFLSKALSHRPRHTG